MKKEALNVFKAYDATSPARLSLSNERNIGKPSILYSIKQQRKKEEPNVCAFAVGLVGSASVNRWDGLWKTKTWKLEIFQSAGVAYNGGM